MSWFDRVYVISLSIRSDRLDALYASLPRSICDVVTFQAVHGDTVRPPRYWHSGNGAWGCYRSHVNVLEDARQNRLKSYLVLEDDAVFRDDFDLMLNAFMTALPSDWEQAYLGGQLIHENQHPPKRINSEVLMPYNVNRTHAFAVHERGYEKLYDHLFALPFAYGEHIDHHLGRLHESGSFSVYVPNKWLVGQASGSSNISGQVRNTADFWDDPQSCAIDEEMLIDPVCIFLEAPLNVAKLLSMRGWHIGNWLSEDGLDRGVCQAVACFDPYEPLKCWFGHVQREVVRARKVLPCLYHPRLSFEYVSSLDFAKFIHIKADTVDSALAQLETWNSENECIHLGK